MTLSHRGSRGAGGTSTGGLTPTPIKTAPYTASPGELVRVDSSGNSVPVTFPLSAPPGSTIGVKETASTPQGLVAVATQPDTIDGLSSLTVSAFQNEARTFIKDSSGTWVLANALVTNARLLRVNSPAAVTTLATSGADRDAQTPQFMRSPNNPILDGAATPLAKIYWPWVVKLPAGVSPAFGNDNYYMYFSTDHDATTGGIYMASASSPTGPFTYRQKVYADSTVGDQTETPTVIWNEDESLFFMYYQNRAAGGNATQATCLATSSNGITWTRVGVAFPFRGYTYEWAGSSPVNNTHTGYARVHRIGSLWFAYSLTFGGNYGAMMLWYSRDGRTWWPDHRIMNGESSATRDATMRWSWNGVQVFRWYGQLWAYGPQTQFVSGATVGSSKWGMAPLASSLRKIIGKPRTVLTYPLASSWETNEDHGQMLYAENGKLYFYYQLGQKVGVAVTT